MMKLEILDELLNNDLDGYLRLSYYLHGKIPTKIKQLSLKKLIRLIKNSIYYDTFIEAMDSIDEELLYKSDIHGINHNIRVAILITGIAVLEKVSLDDYKILIMAAMYHDIGRCNDYVDDYHGTRSAEMLKNMDLGLSSSDLRLLQLACIYHSINDKNINLDKYEHLDKNRASRLIKILKDADALDRIRVDALDYKYLRSKSSLSLVHASYDLLENFNKYLKTNKITRG